MTVGRWFYCCLGLGSYLPVTCRAEDPRLEKRNESRTQTHIAKDMYISQRSTVIPKAWMGGRNLVPRGRGTTKQKRRPAPSDIKRGSSPSQGGEKNAGRRKRQPTGVQSAARRQNWHQCAQGRSKRNPPRILGIPWRYLRRGAAESISPRYS